MPIQGLRALLGTLECTVANLSLTGAMLLARREISVGSEAILTLEREPLAVTDRVRVVRCEALEVAIPGAVWRQQHYAIGVTFVGASTDLSTTVRQLIKTTGIEHSYPRILVLSGRDEITHLIEKTLSEAEYVPRVLTHREYALSTAKRISAKAIIVSLKLDSEFSSRHVIETIRADAAMTPVPIILYAQHAWLQPAHLAYIANRRLRLLSIPFTPEELVLTLDRMIEDAFEGSIL